MFVYTYMHVATINEKCGHALDIEKVCGRIWREEREKRDDTIIFLKHKNKNYKALM